jgi:hypothetical protein
VSALVLVSGPAMTDVTSIPIVTAIPAIVVQQRDSSAPTAPMAGSIYGASPTNQSTKAKQK